MSQNTGFTQAARELLREKGPLTSKDIRNEIGNLSKDPTELLDRALDIYSTGGWGYWYLEGQEKRAKLLRKRLYGERKEKRRRYGRQYARKHNQRYNPINVDFKILDLFDNKTELTVEEICEKLDIVPFRVTEALESFNTLGEISPIKEENGHYVLNKDSPYWRIANGYWK